MQPQQPYQPQPPQQPLPPPQPQVYQPQQQPYQQPQYSIDYLNQIAPQQHKPKPSLLRLALPLLGVVIVLFIAMALFSSLHGSSSNTLPTVALQLQSLQTIADGAQQKIKSNQLRVTNSNLSLYLTNANRDIATPLKTAGVDPTKLPPSLTIKTETDKLTAALEDARLNAIYDRVYARNMDYQLTTLLLQMAQLDKASSDATTHSFLQKTADNLKTVRDQFANYTDSTN